MTTNMQAFDMMLDAAADEYELYRQTESRREAFKWAFVKYADEAAHIASHAPLASYRPRPLKKPARSIPVRKG